MADAPTRFATSVKEQRIELLRAKAFYKTCMDVAQDRYGWQKLAL